MNTQRSKDRKIPHGTAAITLHKDAAATAIENMLEQDQGGGERANLLSSFSKGSIIPCQVLGARMALPRPLRPYRIRPRRLFCEAAVYCSLTKEMPCSTPPPGVTGD